MMVVMFLFLLLPIVAAPKKKKTKKSASDGSSSPSNAAMEDAKLRWEQVGGTFEELRKGMETTKASHDARLKEVLTSLGVAAGASSGSDRKKPKKKRRL